MSKVYEVTDQSFHKYLVKAPTGNIARRKFKKNYPNILLRPKMTSYYGRSMKQLKSYGHTNIFKDIIR